MENIKNPYKCPNCGADLILKEGQYGRFMACPRYPDCKYTRALWTYQATHEKPYCEKCKGEGKLPFINKEGKLIPHTFTFCECHEDESEHYTPYPLDLIDFPVSYLFRAYEAELNGEYLSSIELPEERETPEQSIEPEWSRRQWDAVTQLKAQVLHYQSKVITLLESKKKEGYTIEE